MKKTSFKNILIGTRNKLAQFQNKVNQLKRQPHDDLSDLKLARLSAAPDRKHVTIDVSAGTVARSTLVVLLLLLCAFFIYQISGILVLFFVSFLFAAALDPIIDFLHRKRVPRGAGVLIVYLIIFVVFGLLLSNLVILLGQQIGEIAGSISKIVENLTQNPSQFPFAQQLKPYFDQFYQTIDIKAVTSQLQSTLLSLSTLLLNISFGLLNVVIVLILTFFMTVEEKGIEDFFLSLFPSRHGKYISTRLEAVKVKIGNWLRGQLFLSLAATMLSYIGLLFLNVKYALTLSVISGVMMLIPVVGRGFAWIVSFPIVFNQSPVIALWFSVYYFVLQQIENNILVHYIMNRVVGLSPIIISFAMLVGAQYLGIPGLIISIPIATSIAIFVKDYTEKAK